MEVNHTGPPPGSRVKRGLFLCVSLRAHIRFSPLPDRATKASNERGNVVVSRVSCTLLLRTSLNACLPSIVPLSSTEPYAFAIAQVLNEREGLEL